MSPPFGLMPPVWDKVFCLGWGFLAVLWPPIELGPLYFIFSFFKLSISLSRYQSDQFGWRVIVIEDADLNKRYRNIVIEVGVKLTRAHHYKLHIFKLCRLVFLFYGNVKRSIHFGSTALVSETRLVYEGIRNLPHYLTFIFAGHPGYSSAAVCWNQANKDTSLQIIDYFKIEIIAEIAHLL